MFQSKNKTFRAEKGHKKGGVRDKLSTLIKNTLSTLGTASMKEAVKCPPNEDRNEWIAVNTVDFYNEINMLYGSIAEFCTKETCPEMKAGQHTYLWADGVKIKKPISVSAPEYVDLLMQWVESQLNDETVFPVEYGTAFPKDFMNVVKTIFKRYFRVYAHIYHHHFKKVVDGGAEAHLNTCFKHLVYFITEFDLVDQKELEPLKDLVDKILVGAADEGKT